MINTWAQTHAQRSKGQGLWEISHPSQVTDWKIKELSWTLNNTVPYLHTVQLVWENRCMLWITVMNNFRTWQCLNYLCYGVISSFMRWQHVLVTNYFISFILLHKNQYIKSNDKDFFLSQSRFSVRRGDTNKSQHALVQHICAIHASI